MSPMIAGRVAEPMIDITSSDEARLVYGPRLFRLNAKIVGNIIELKKPAKTTAQTAGDPVVLSATATQRNPPPANMESRRGAEMYFMIHDPLNRPIMKPNKCSFR